MYNLFILLLELFTVIYRSYSIKELFSMLTYRQKAMHGSSVHDSIDGDLLPTKQINNYSTISQVSIMYYIKDYATLDRIHNLNSFLLCLYKYLSDRRQFLSDRTNSCQHLVLILSIFGSVS